MSDVIMADFVTRFAPSPTGLLHLGHAFAAFCVFDAAQEAGGQALLRIEDIDQTRCRPEFETAVYEDLSWLGLRWPQPARRQSDFFADYERALERLRERGVVYRCFRTRAEALDEIARAPHMAAEGPDGPVFIGGPLAEDEERRRLESGAPFAWRLSIEKCRAALGARFDALSFLEEDVDGVNPRRIRATPHIFGDAIIARKDTGTSYHLASIHDDALAGVTHVIRGEDLKAAAHLHVLLQALFDFPTPTYRHHRLVVDGAGKRLAKRDRAQTLRALREAGATPDALRLRLGVWR